MTDPRILNLHEQRANWRRGKAEEKGMSRYPSGWWIFPVLLCYIIIGMVGGMVVWWNLL